MSGATCCGFTDQQRPEASLDGRLRKISTNMFAHGAAPEWPVQDQTWAKLCRSDGVSSALGRNSRNDRRSSIPFRNALCART